MMDRTERLTAALLLLADLVDSDPAYIPVFQRIDEELAAQSAGHESKLARARAKIARAA